MRFFTILPLVIEGTVGKRKTKEPHQNHAFLKHSCRLYEQANSLTPPARIILVPPKMCSCRRSFSSICPLHECQGCLHKCQLDQALCGSNSPVILMWQPPWALGIHRHLSDVIPFVLLFATCCFRYPGIHHTEAICSGKDSVMLIHPLPQQLSGLSPLPVAAQTLFPLELNLGPQNQLNCTPSLSSGNPHKLLFSVFL